ncbi:hypothetical protein ABB37_05019 [Leptomonas pyrrhocoris]|uniref:Uncharacterized protein n=1 Tax=Leptomonas pyrrhocoris TaxID=157538 RepID=A0A0N1J4T5_LEPPY|nr:hypothetical protein ABB37_05019 [Leptomonas pyrrhocoris]KPA79978.1 hypothetical protein ABB37_05019 [Leptomonas pyrrhocoris]|eukprot:XP_015658417.1 hypothetical protein ABB37_05019 [Leptomonas pyrrhocoris]
MMLRQGQPAKRWGALCLLAAYVVSVSILVVYAAGIKITVPEKDEDWPWKPQLDLFVSDTFFTGEAELHDADHWQVLSQVGAPLRIAADSSYDLMQLLELVSFMRADGKGTCPFYTTPYRRMYYWFHPDELALLYGEARWIALQRLQEPKAWSLVLHETVGPAVRAAEGFIEHLKTADLPGQLLLRLRESNGNTQTLHVPLADFRVSVRIIFAGHPLEYRLPQLTVDGEAVGRRRHIQRFLHTKQKVDAQVAEFDAATVRAQNSLRASLMELQREEQDAYDTHARFKARYQRFLLDRQARREAAEAANETERADRLDGKGVADARKGPLMTSSLLEIHAVAGQVRTAEERRGVSCRKIYAAWDTLRGSGVRWEHDGRATQLRRLHARHGCRDDLAPLQRALHGSPSAGEADEDGDATVAELHPTARQVWVGSVAEMMMQREKSGRPPTIAQLYAVLFAVWKAAAGEATTKMANESFSASGFVRFVDHFVESGDAVEMAGGWLPRFVRAELHYVVGILDLVTYQHLKSTATRQSADCEADGVVRGVVQLYEALSAGSHHAAGALATLREHGIFTRQHTKAAMLLLLQSMRVVPSHLLRQLLLSAPPSPTAPSSAPSPFPTLHHRALNARGLDASRLLRFEQFYAVDHTIREVDDPFMTRAGITTLVAVSNENIQSTDDAPELEDVYREAAMEREQEDYEGSITVRLSRRVLKANMLFSGFKDTKLDPHEAQCELLVVLRRLGYLCDLNVSSLHSADRSISGRPRYLETRIGVPLPDSCVEHDTELYSVLGNTRHTLLLCPGSQDAFGHGHPREQVPTSETLFAMLHQVLLSLSYVHLLHTHKYELSHMYAALSVEMSIRLQRLLVKRLDQVRETVDRFANVFSKVENATPPAPVSPYGALRMSAEGTGADAWAAAAIMEDIENGTEDYGKEVPKQSPSRSLDERARRAVERCRSVTDSPFVITESLLLLALSRWAKRGPLVGNAVEVSAVEQQLSAWTMEPFQLLGQLLGSADASNQRAEQNESRGGGEVVEEALRDLKRSEPPNSPADAALLPHSRDAGRTPAPLDVHALFLICLSAMKRWKSDFPSVHLLDSTSYSVRRTDPFVMASFLLHAEDATTHAPLISIPKLRDLAVAASPHFLGQTPHFLPLVDDTVESYAARLLRFAARHIHALEPTVELLRSGDYGVGFTMDNTAPSSTAGLRRHGVVDDAPPRRFRLQTLRRVKQQTIETADLQPLLYASDVHDYFNQSRWTYMGVALNAAYNALLYPFTFTTSESVLDEMEKHLQFIAPEEREEVLRAFVIEGEGGDDNGFEIRGRDSSGESTTEDSAQRASSAAEQQAPPHALFMNVVAGEETTSVSDFVEGFAKSIPLREHFIACQLFSFTLESGMPEGFSLILYEAADRGNPFLRDVANYLADAVFGRWTASVWTEHHLSAQWQREKSELAIDGSILSLNTRSPFGYASLEGRQELFARLSRWRAATAAAAAAAANQSGLSAARDQLLWCAGFLTRKAYYGSAQIYPLGYEGALYPAADLACLAELNQLVASHGGPAGTKAKWSKTQWRQAQRNGTDLLRDLGDRLAYDYGLIERPPARHFALSENEFRRNVSNRDTATEAVDRQHAPLKRFMRVSTQLVEPWNRRSRQIDVESLGYGEGVYYNGRLHRVSGYRWGSMMQSWWLWVRHFFP